ncbi:heavy-metal-associated domain-containing protein [Candidatus Daviesbacteria bacterium]|nr:heavy-metal-associated domain-containing protein [Candidatus Daviesbacteria bacterium]
MDNKFKILGMHCGACQKLIEKKLSKIDGVLTVNAQLSGDVSVSANRSINPDEIRLALEGTDYQIL